MNDEEKNFQECQTHKFRALFSFHKPNLHINISFHWIMISFI